MTATPSNSSPGAPPSNPSLEEQVAALKQQLAQAQKLTALGELVGTTTHEFNNVLMTILNYARMGLRHKDEATRDKALDKIHIAAQRAAKLTNSVLALARNRGPSFEPTDLKAIIEDTLFLLEREMSKYKIAVETQIGEAPEIPAIGNQLQQVILNLLINARQAMPNGGTVTVKLLHDAAAKTVDIVIRDTGCGIPQDKLRRIFEPFYTTKSGPDESGKGGTGLGLAACRGIIETHRGKIRVESTVGKGTAFTLRLPTMRRDEPAPLVAPPAMTAVAPVPPTSLGASQ